MQVAQFAATAASLTRGVGGPLAALPQLPGIDLSAAVADGASPESATQTRRTRETERRRSTPSELAQFCDGTLQAERRLDRTSQAFKRQEALGAARQDLSQARDAFRQALDDAASRRQLAARPTSTTTTTPAAAEAGDHAAIAEAALPAADDDASELRPAPAKAAMNAKSTDGAPLTASAPRSSAAAPAAPQAASAASAAVSAPAWTPTAATTAVSVTTATVTSTPVAEAARAAGTTSTTSAASARSAPGSAAPEGPRSAERFATLLRGARNATPDAPESKNDPNVARLLRWARTEANKDGGSATMRLDPPELGKIRVQMEVHKDAVRLAIDTDTPLAHRLLTDEVETLRKSLQASGLSLERIEVRPPATPDVAAPPDGSTAFDARQDGGDASAHAGTDSQGQAREEPPGPLEPDVGSELVRSATESRVNIVA
jgi:flagellar hook-length control protein FliK